MQPKSISRELALLLLEQVTDNQVDSNNIKSLTIEKILNKALDTLINHWKEELEFCANQLEIAYDQLRDSELKEFDKKSNKVVRIHLENCLNKGQGIINSLSESIDLTRLLSLCDQSEIRKEALDRIILVLKNVNKIDEILDNAMEGWRLKRLPRIDRNILRLAYVDFNFLDIPIAVACNEAVNLANRYSDEQGRKMINGILRRVQKHKLIKI